MTSRTTTGMNTTRYIHRFERGSDPSAAPLLLLHGTGGDENDLIPVARRISPGSTLLSPRGDVSENGMPRFFRRLAEGVFEPNEIIRRTLALADFVEFAAEKYGFDRTRLVAIGFSNGANIASSLLLLRPEALSSAVLFRPMVVLEPDVLPDLHGKRALITSGTNDPIVPEDHPRRLTSMLRDAGASVELKLVPASHGLVAEDIASAAEFVRD